MSTTSQQAANRLNSAASTGPITPEGREISSRNALKHGYSSKKACFDPIHDPSYNLRLITWREKYHPTTDVGEYHLQQLVVTSLKIESADQDLEALSRVLRQRAESSWENDGMADAAVLLVKISKNPQVVARKLQQCYFGCQLLMEEWGLLGEALFRNGVLSQDERSYALDLMGYNPKFRNGRTQIDPPANHPDPRQWIDCRMHKEADRLKALINDGLATCDQQNHDMALRGRGVTQSPAGRQLIRHERDLHCRFKKILVEFRLAEGLLELTKRAVDVDQNLEPKAPPDPQEVPPSELKKQRFEPGPKPQDTSVTDRMAAGLDPKVVARIQREVAAESLELAKIAQSTRADRDDFDDDKDTTDIEDVLARYAAAHGDDRRLTKK